MKKQEKFSIKKRLKSFTYAFNGLKVLFQEEHNSRIHLFATICVIVAGVLLKLSLLEWAAVLVNAISAAAIGLLVFIPRIIHLFP
ncbi:MAG: diacylglycerol kinase family protein [Bacteroidales bacterium]|nr:diacylglycerol kinase family protein [Bacteroidales bacterium]